MSEKEQKFKNGDKVYFVPDYAAGCLGERFTLSQWDDDRGRGWAGDKDGRGWYVNDYMLTKKNPTKG